MNQQRLTVFAWPNDASKLHLENGLLVFALQILPTAQRSEARRKIRAALQEVLAILLNCPASEIKLHSQVGQAVKLDNKGHNIGLSISHEPGLSIAAINLNGQVGVDLMAVDSIPESAELEVLATEYLGEKVAEYIASQPVETKKEAFATAWTVFEASLKLKGETLIEWSVARDEQLKRIKQLSLNLTDGYIGTIAYQLD